MAVAIARARVDHLPADLTSFVGRRRELALLKRALRASQLVTLTGVGGVGKTRLGLRAARDLASTLTDGAYFVALDQLNDPELVDAAVAETLGLRAPATGSRLDVMRAYLSGRQLVLVLDNCEHLLDACAALAGSLVPSCAGLRILATSREPLRVPGEVAITMPALSVPQRDEQLRLGVLARYEAVSLFVRRATAVCPSFAVTEDNRAAVAGICRRLDGLPLAIELAAARISVLSPAQILHRLNDRYRLLNAVRRGGPPRQQTLRASIEWSFTLCAPEEQRLWMRLAVFHGSFEVDAVCEVCADEVVPQRRVPTLLACLVDKSILIAEDYRFGTRYRMLETIAEYARERLAESGEHGALRRRHRVWCERLTLRMHTEWISDRQEYWLDRMHREQPNLRATLDACLAERDGAEPGGVEAAMRILVALPPAYLWARDLLGETRRWLDRALAIDRPPTVAGARALMLASQLAIAQGDLAAATPLLAQGRELARRLDDQPALAFACYAAGNAAMYAGDAVTAIAEFTTGLAISVEMATLNQRLDTLLCLAIAAGLVGDDRRAVAYYETMLALTEPCGELFNRSNALWALGLALWRRGDRARAADLQREGLRLKWRIGDRLSAALSLEAIAWAAADDDPELAATVLGVAAALWHAGGTPMDAHRHLIDDHDACIRKARATLGEAAAEAAFNRGRSLPAEDGLAYALGERTLRRRDARATDPTALTHRQAQVARLIAKGLTNRQIGRHLGISTRTADAHVDAILAKLGLTSRAQIAAWITAAEPSAPTDRPAGADHRDQPRL